MAHFLTLVLLPSDTADLAAEAKKRMAPYFHREVYVARETGENPNAKCDGFVIGGRFDGVIRGDAQHFSLTPTEFQARYGDDVVKHANNVAVVADIVGDSTIYAAVLPDGTWRGDDTHPKGAWAKEWVRIKTEYGDHIAVAFDCHC